MTRKELNLAIFEGTAEAVLWQPRLETWIHHHRTEGTLPDRFRDRDNFQIYDALRCSVRYAAAAGIDRFEDREDLKVIFMSGYSYGRIRAEDLFSTRYHFLEKPLSRADLAHAVRMTLDS